MLDRELDDAWLTELSKNVGDSLHQMRRRGTLRTLQRGRYLAAANGWSTPRFDDLELVAEAALRRLSIDYYASWHTALWHYGLIDQQSRRVYIATTRRKRPVQLGLASVRFVAVAERKFFGRVLIDDLEWPIWMATVEKSILDSLDQPGLAAPVPVIVNALGRAFHDDALDPELLVRQAIKFGSPSLNRRLGYFMELLEIPVAEELTLHLGRGYAVPLAPGGSPSDRERHSVNRRWRVYEDPAIISTALELK